jgi:hypothetical protein
MRLAASAVLRHAHGSYLPVRASHRSTARATVASRNGETQTHSRIPSAAHPQNPKTYIGGGKELS